MQTLKNALNHVLSIVRAARTPLHMSFFPAHADMTSASYEVLRIQNRGASQKMMPMHTSFFPAAQAALRGALRSKTALSGETLGALQTLQDMHIDIHTKVLGQELARVKMMKSTLEA